MEISGLQTLESQASECEKGGRKLGEGLEKVPLLCWRRLALEWLLNKKCLLMG